MLIAVVIIYSISMKQEEKASIIRVFSDLIKSDCIIDVREIEALATIKEKYALRKEHEVEAASLSLEKAVKILLDSDACLRHDIIGDIVGLAMADNFCAREEALLILALRTCFRINSDINARIISVDTSSVFIEPTQILFVESEFDNDVNWNINDNYRAIMSEIRLAGFDFVYLPMIAEHFRSMPLGDLHKIASFLYPKASSERIATVTRQLVSLSTSEFCKDQLAAKLGVSLFAEVCPSLMMKIGESIVNDKKIANFLIVEIERDAVILIRKLLDIFTDYYHTFRLNYLKEEPGRFVYTGFYKQVFDLYMLRKGVKSSILIDVYRDEIRFMEADVKLDKLHRREKALYALFLLESSSGGINFNKPYSPKQLEKYEKRINAIQKKYSLIYKKFGGEPEKAPRLDVSEIRLPMISLIKRQLSKMDDILFHVEDYMIQRNIFGNYGVRISPSQCYCVGANIDDVCLLSDSIEWQRISAL